MGRPSGRDPRSAAEARAAARGDNAREKRRAGGRADVAAAAAAAVEDGDERAQATERASRDVRRSTATAKSSNSSTQLLSEDSLARLNAANEKAEMVEVERAERKERRQRRHDQRDRHDARRYHHQQHHHHHYQDDPYRYGKVKKRRVVSGPALEEGRVRKREIEAEMDGNGGGGDGGGSAWWSGGGWRRRKGFWIAIGLLVLLLIILIPVGVLVVGKNNRSDSSGTSAEGAPANANLKDISESDIPTAAKGTILDPFVWYDTLDFNVTYTDATVGGLPVMGLNSSWDDSARANDQVPALDQAWEYGKMPIRGVNVGGWLSLEPFITPSLFEPYDSRLGVVDEYTLTRHLGPRKAAQTLEKHYATFVTEQTFAEIAAAGLDHVRIPFSYWAVATYPDDPYVPQIAWRYLLRGIEWARKYGLRIKLDLHGAPGSQNGWNHSGRQGVIGWLNSTEGAVNAQRTLDLHDRLSRFFAQPRYANILTIYGLLNEPKMIKLPLDAVLDWSTQAMDLIRRNGITAHIAVGDGFLGLPKWKGRFAGQDRVLLDVHQYVIFNADQLSLPHDEKLKFACEVWSRQMEQSGDPNTGFGPTICGEWSQADTDCTRHLNNVGLGARWTGTFNHPTEPVTTPLCPQDPPSSCSCDTPNAADPSSYPAAYRAWLRAFAQAQMHAFERPGAWGWFYWTWDTERAPQWSWKKARAAGLLPAHPAKRDFACERERLEDDEGSEWKGLDEGI